MCQPCEGGVVINCQKSVKEVCKQPLNMSCLFHSEKIFSWLENCQTDIIEVHNMTCEQTTKEITLWYWVQY